MRVTTSNGHTDGMITIHMHPRDVIAALIDSEDFQTLSSQARHVLITVLLAQVDGISPTTEDLRRWTGLSESQVDVAMAELAATPWIEGAQP